MQPQAGAKLGRAKGGRPKKDSPAKASKPNAKSKGQKPDDKDSAKSVHSAFKKPKTENDDSVGKKKKLFWYANYGDQIIYT